MLQKIIQVGNSLAITIPKQFISESGLRAGDLMFVQPDSATKTLVVTDEANASSVRLNPQLFSWLKTIEETYGPAIKALAKQ